MAAQQTCRCAAHFRPGLADTCSTPIRGSPNTRFLIGNFNVAMLSLPVGAVPSASANTVEGPRDKRR